MPNDRGDRWKRRRGPPRLLAMGIAAAIVGGSAFQGLAAQIASGISGSSTTSTFDEGEAWRTLRAFGHCYSSRNLAGALALIATEPGSRAEAETYRRLFRGDSQCLGGNTELAMPVAMVRGAIAEGLYRNRAALPANLTLAAPVAGAPIRRFSEAARCYAATHRDQVRSLVETTAPGSRQELTALNDMASDFIRCLPEAARNRGLNPTQVRYLVAEALLRLPASPSAAAGQR
jgi:hypothetical protein